MAKVTSKHQVTVPRAIAEQYGIDPGDEIQWEAAGDVIRVVPPRRAPARDIATRLRLFDQATERQRTRKSPVCGKPSDRGWTRDELYGRGRSR
jgi:bifunctional DNA-binding transcriptional regulator/antitoxin component of YhaV-PrlF toxin-antitoxin module